MQAPGGSPAEGQQPEFLLPSHLIGGDLTESPRPAPWNPESQFAPSLLRIPGEDGEAVATVLFQI